MSVQLGIVGWAAEIAAKYKHCLETMSTTNVSFIIDHWIKYYKRQPNLQMCLNSSFRHGEVSWSTPKAPQARDVLNREISPLRVKHVNAFEIQSPLYLFSKVHKEFRGGNIDYSNFCNKNSRLNYWWFCVGTVIDFFTSCLECFEVFHHLI